LFKLVTVKIRLGWPSVAVYHPCILGQRNGCCFETCLLLFRTHCY